MLFFFRFTVHEAIAMLEDLNDPDIETIDINIEPPDCSYHTDEDSADEEDGTIDNFSARQLLAPCVVTTSSSRGVRNVIGDFDPDPDPAAETTSTVASSSSGPQQKRKKVAPVERSFVKRDIPKSDKVNFEDRPKSQWLDGKDMSPTSFFELFFDEEVVELIITQSNLYAAQNGKSTRIDAEELKLLLAIIIVSGYIPLPRRRMYWEDREDSKNAAVASTMTRNRFDELLSIIHFSNNETLDKNDKMAKIRPLLSMLNERFLSFWPESQNISIDESMVPYYGRHSAKQFIRGKPIRYGFKMWCLNTPDGYLIQTEPYQGKGTVKINPEVGMGGSVVLDLLSELPPLNYNVFFDNLFTSLPLLEILRSMGMNGTGTLRANRLQKCPVASTDEVKKKERGYIDYRRDLQGGCVVVRWNDNNVVTAVSTAFGVEPTHKVKRYSSEKKQHVQVTMPDVIKYNANMGGTDRMDQNLANYRPTIRVKKWWWALFVFCVGTSTHNAWQLYRKSDGAKKSPKDFLEFLRSIAMTYIMKFRNRPASLQAGRPKSSNERWPVEVRFDGVNHFLIKSDKQRKCAMCKKNARNMCSKCTNCPLHKNCFVPFHTC